MLLGLQEYWSAWLDPLNSVFFSSVDVAQMAFQPMGGE
jgi:hypothetical protein